MNQILPYGFSLSSSPFSSIELMGAKRFLPFLENISRPIHLFYYLSISMSPSCCSLTNYVKS